MLETVALDSSVLSHASHLDPDETFVVDVLDRREDLDVQVKLAMNGEWHRKAVGGLFTACGRPLGGYAARPEQYDGAMCEHGCFSVYELSLIPTRANAPDKPSLR